MGRQSLWENRLLSATGSRTLAFGYIRYGHPTQATAGLFVYQHLLRNNYFSIALIA